MSFLRRLLRGGDRDDSADHPSAAPSDPVTADADERSHELELARFDQERIDDLIRRQQRYADRSWTPAAQGGERRADDADKPAD